MQSNNIVSHNFRFIIVLWLSLVSNVKKTRNIVSKNIIFDV